MHINDPDYFNQIYSVTSKMDKDYHFYRFMGTPDASFGTANAELHRARRKANSRFFSQAAVSSLEPSVNQCVEKMCERIREHAEAKKPVHLSYAFRSLAGDVVSHYVLPQGSNLLDSPDFAESYTKTIRSLAAIGVWNRHMAFLIPLFFQVPRWLVTKISTEGGVRAFDWQMALKQQVETVVLTDKASSTSESGRSLLHGIMSSDLPASDKTVERLWQEALTITGAGTETTGNTLDVITFHVLSNHDILHRLKQELAQAYPTSNDFTSYETVRKLPYLTACVNEGLRLAGSVSGRLPRSNPNTTLSYDTYSLPPGTVISMTIGYMHTNPMLFPNVSPLLFLTSTTYLGEAIVCLLYPTLKTNLPPPPLKHAESTNKTSTEQPTSFNPDRWLHADADASKYFAPFSKGSRNCIGKDLAVVELYLAVANVFGRFDMELFNTTHYDVSLAHDFFAPFNPADSAGLRVMVKA